MTDDDTPPPPTPDPAVEPPAAPPPEIDRPGVFDVPHAAYHADPVVGGSLSRSEAKWLLPPSCPAKFAYNKINRPPSTRCMDIGTAAHTMLLETGPEVVPINASDWRTKRAKQERDEAHALGNIPLLEREYEVTAEMVAVVRADPTASVLLDPGLGVVAEMTLVWWDKQTGVGRRVMVDALPPTPRDGRRMIIADYKTCDKADEESVAKAAHNNGYHMQAAQIIDGVTALGLNAGAEVVMVFVFQEKNPPYLINLVELDVMALRIGRDLNRRALDLYAECTAAGHWPGYHEGIMSVPLPVWVENRYVQEYLT